MPDMVINIRSTFDDAGIRDAVAGVGSVGAAAEESARSYGRMLADFVNAPLPAVTPELEEVAGAAGGGNYLTRMIARYAGRGIGTELGGRAGGMLGMIGGVGLGGMGGMTLLAGLVGTEAGIALYRYEEAQVAERRKQDVEALTVGGAFWPGTQSRFRAPASPTDPSQMPLFSPARYAYDAEGMPGLGEAVAGHEEAKIARQQWQMARELAEAGIPQGEALDIAQRLAATGLDPKDILPAISKGAERLRPGLRGRYGEELAGAYIAQQQGDVFGEAAGRFGMAGTQAETAMQEIGLTREQREARAQLRQEVETAGIARQSEVRHIEDQTRAETILAETRERGAGSYGEKLQTELHLIAKTAEADKQKLDVIEKYYGDKALAAQRFADSEKGRYDREEAAYNKVYASQIGPVQPYQTTEEGRKLKQSADDAALGAQNAAAAWQAYRDQLGDAKDDIDAVARAQGDLAREQKAEEDRRMAQQAFGFDTALTRAQLETQISTRTGMLEAGAKDITLTPTQRMARQIAAARSEYYGLGQLAGGAQSAAEEAVAKASAATTPEEYRYWSEEALRLSAESDKGLGLQVIRGAEIGNEEEQQAFMAGDPHRSISSEMQRQQRIQQQMQVGRYRLGLQTGAELPIRRMGEAGTGAYRGMGEHPSDANYHPMGEANFLPVVHGFVTAVGKMTEAVTKATDAHNQPDSGPVQTLPVN